MFTENKNLNDRFSILTDYVFDSVSYPIIFVPTDFSSDTITRYICKKINEDLFFEISENTFQDLNGNNLYVCQSFTWKIKGNKNDTIVNGKVMIQGVINYNIQQISNLAKTIPNIKLFLTNPLQFYKGL